uniref:Ras-GEF domain-containing protein n=1 Tax=Arcella intermedia TaxID=1963864 RepID=A0A6B2L0T9_9EUKA
MITSIVMEVDKGDQQEFDVVAKELGLDGDLELQAPPPGLQKDHPPDGISIASLDLAKKDTLKSPIRKKYKERKTASVSYMDRSKAKKAILKPPTATFSPYTKKSVKTHAHFHQSPSSPEIASLSKPKESVAPLPWKPEFGSSPLFSAAECAKLLIGDDPEKGKCILGGPVHMLISLTLVNISDVDSVKAFVLSFKHYLSPEKLLDHLIRLFKRSSSLPDNFKIYIQSRVILLILRWIEMNIKDFKDERLLDMINGFLLSQFRNGTYGSVGKTWGMFIQQTWREQITLLYLQENRPDHILGAPESYISDKIKRLSQNCLTKSDYQSLSGLDFNGIELARQMTLIDQRVFMMIPDTEFLKKRFAKAPTSPNLQALVDRFNIVSKWVGTEIASTPNFKQRLKTLTHFIHVAEHLKEFHNWHTFLAVISGLSLTAVQRLRQTWKALSPQVLKKWQEFETLSSPLQNFGKLRKAYQNSIPPTIYPILILTKDLTFIEDGNEDWRNKETKQLNYEKMRLLGQVISQIKEAQRVHYPFNSVPIMMEYLENVFYIENSDDLHQLSQTIEGHNNKEV